MNRLWQIVTENRQMQQSVTLCLTSFLPLLPEPPAAGAGETASVPPPKALSCLRALVLESHVCKSVSSWREDVKEEQSGRT